jgi:hypothetical protein
VTNLFNKHITNLLVVRPGIDSLLQLGQQQLVKVVDQVGVAEEHLQGFARCKRLGRDFQVEFQLLFVLAVRAYMPISTKDAQA